MLLRSHLVPDVQQHDIVFIQVLLGKVGYLRGNEVTALIGALKEAGGDVETLLVQP